MTVGIQASVSIGRDRSAEIIARVAGLAAKKVEEFAEGVVAQARQNAEEIPFEESHGDLAREIHFSRIRSNSYRIETKSGHASYIELGTRFIDGRAPFLWPAYRMKKREFLTQGKWL
jgi:hypothetical protein